MSCVPFLGEYNRLGGRRPRRGGRRPGGVRAPAAGRRAQGEGPRGPEGALAVRLRVRQAHAALQTRQGKLPSITKSVDL